MTLESLLTRILVIGFFPFATLLLLGRWIVFKARPEDNVDETKIEKRFTLNDKKQLSRFRELLEQIPSEYIFVAEQAISFSKRFYNLQLNESIHISLTDHLHSAELLKSDFSLTI